jgi:hypothetical protein
MCCPGGQRIANMGMGDVLAQGGSTSYGDLPADRITAGGDRLLFLIELLTLDFQRPPLLLEVFFEFLDLFAAGFHLQRPSIEFLTLEGQRLPPLLGPLNFVFE